MKPLPFSLAATPELKRWIRLTDDGRVVAFTGKVEIGQGLMTALRTIVAEELDVAPVRVEVVSARTGATPDEGTTAGSMSIETSGAALRQASAWARRVLLERASARLGVPRTELTVEDGRVTAPGVNEVVDYWQFANTPFDFEVREWTPEKPSGEYRIVGCEGQRRSDVPAKATGAAFVHDAVPELHARLVRPPSIHHRLVELDAKASPPASWSSMAASWRWHTHASSMPSALLSASPNRRSGPSCPRPLVSRSTRLAETPRGRFPFVAVDRPTPSAGGSRHRTRHAIRDRS